MAGQIPVLQPGSDFHHYRIERQLGAGGMGQVYVALNLRLGRREALKVLNPGLSADPSFIQRFEREARHAASIDHPNVVAIFHFDSASDPTWMAMQYVEGSDAAELIRASPYGVNPDQAVAIIAQAAEGIDAAHRHGLLHRDIKPANLLISAHSGQVRVTDFGIAKALASGTQITQTGLVVGTTSYLAPEVLRGGHADHRSDVYALGCTLFELLSGRPPYIGDHPASIMYAHIHEPIPSISSLRPSLPSSLDAVFKTALAKEPDDRFQSCRELARAAASATKPVADTPLSTANTEHVHQQPDLAPGQATVSVAKPRLPPVPPPPPARWSEPVFPQRSLKSRALALTALVTVFVCLVAGGAWYFSRDFRQGSSGPLSITALAAYDVDGTRMEIDTSSTPVDPAGSGSARCSGVSIAMAGALTGDYSALGINIINGVKLALEKHNEANPDCQVGLEEFDTEGDVAIASNLAPNIVDDSSIIGLVGPAFSGEARATGQIFDDAGLVSVTASATNPVLAQSGWRTFFRGLASDASQGPALANYLTRVAGAAKVCVIEDDTDYGSELARAVTSTLGAAASSSCSAQVEYGDTDFSAVVDKVKAADPDAVFYGGYYPEAAALVSQLRSAGVTALFAAGDGANDPQFVAQAGDASRGAILSCPCGVGSADFREQYAAFSGLEAGIYSAEAYDLTTILLAGIDSGRTTRADLLAFVSSYDGRGVMGNYKWRSNGELVTSGVWMFEVR